VKITVLGKPRYLSPIDRTIDDSARVPAHIVRNSRVPLRKVTWFELAGPRSKLFFNPRHVRAGIVTCGGLCPGLNDVIRSLFLELHHAYGVKEVLGFQWGYQGLVAGAADGPIRLTTQRVDGIQQHGGTILGTSRGPVDVKHAVDRLIQRKVNVLFTLGGDGTQRGARDLYLEAHRRGHSLAIVGIPKTIDNDVPFVARSFGYLTAVGEAARVLARAHTEARSVKNGIALVKLMGRHAGFIAAGATVANQDVNFVLVPEVPFALDGRHGLLAALEERIRKRSHAVIAVAEGAGQELLKVGESGRDASGNVRLKDVGIYLRERIEEYFKSRKIPTVMRYFDPSYFIRSSPASPEDSILCDRFARQAVHAAMAGKTGLMIGFLHERFMHVPIQMLSGQQKRIDPEGQAWSAVLAATGQPRYLGDSPRTDSRH
jgi:6-phosphofructokinase 1